MVEDAEALRRIANGELFLVSEKCCAVLWKHEAVGFHGNFSQTFMSVTITLWKHRETFSIVLMK